MKCYFQGPDYQRWETDAYGRVWIEPYRKEKTLLMPDARAVTRLQGVMNNWGELLASAAQRYKLPIAWVLALCCAESGGNAGAESPAGAIGLMQVMPMNAGGRDLRDAAQNVDAGCDLLARLQKNGGPWDLLQLCCQYNAGPAKNGGPKVDPSYEFGMVVEVGPSSPMPQGQLVRKSNYLRSIIAYNNWLLNPDDPVPTPDTPGFFVAPPSPIAATPDGSIAPAAVPVALHIAAAGAAFLYLTR